MKAQRDQISFVQDAPEEGLELGLQQGEVIGQNHTYQRMLKLLLTPREELLAFSLADLAAQAVAQKQRLAK